MLIAIYGTFREGEALSYYFDHLRKRGTSEVIELSGVKLFVVGTVPGAKITGNEKDTAVVELIDVDLDNNDAHNFLEIIDLVEGVDRGLYERNSVDTSRGKALIYTKCGNMNGCVEIRDWKEWEEKSWEEKVEAFKKAGKSAIIV